MKVKNLEVLNFYKKEFKIKDVLDIGQTEFISTNLFASIVRFMQNNKSYRYSFSENFKLNDKEKNLLNLVVKNISLEGAYFLNPSFLETVQLKFYHFKEGEKEIFDKYINIIIKNELKNFLTERKVAIQYVNRH